MTKKLRFNKFRIAQLSLNAKIGIIGGTAGNNNSDRSILGNICL